MHRSADRKVQTNLQTHQRTLHFSGVGSLQTLWLFAFALYKKGQYVYLRHTDLKNCEHCNNVSEKILLKEVEKALASISFDDELKLALADELKNAMKLYTATTIISWKRIGISWLMLKKIRRNFWIC